MIPVHQVMPTTMLTNTAKNVITNVNNVYPMVPHVLLVPIILLRIGDHYQVGNVYVRMGILMLVIIMIHVRYVIILVLPVLMPITNVQHVIVLGIMIILPMYVHVRYGCMIH